MFLRASERQWWRKHVTKCRDDEKGPNDASKIAHNDDCFCLWLLKLYNMLKFMQFPVAEKHNNVVL